MEINLSAIILAAGKSGRIGKQKAFLDYHGKPFIVNILEKLLSFSDKIVIVFGYEAKTLMDLISKEKVYDKNKEKIVIEVNDNYERGMFSSIQCGIKKVSDAKFLLIHQVDQPGLPQKFYEEFISQIDEKFEWLQPSYLGKPGHPIIVNHKIVNLILNENIDSNLRILKNKNLFTHKLWECNYPEVLQDIDTNEDYQKLLEGSAK